MTREVSLLILGDSVSAQTGGCFINYVDCLASEWQSDSRLRIFNPSVAGFTTADARAMLKQQLKRGESYDAVVILLGDCDACGFGFLKTRTPLGKEWRRRKDRIYKRLNPLSVRTPRFCFTEQLPLMGFRECVPVHDYVRNIASIIRLAERRGIAVVLVNPTSKLDFVPCNNLGNFIFYKIFGVRDSHEYRVEDEQLALRAALKFHDLGEYDQALAIYSGLVKHEEDDEIKDIAFNNVAAIHYARSQYQQAIDELQTVGLHDNPMSPIVYFNRGLALERLGRSDEAKSNFLLARELDYGTFRMKDSYREGLAKLASHKRSFKYLDLDELLSDEDYIDYCHPTEEGHRKIAAALVEGLQDSFGASKGTEGAAVTVAPVNPDLYLGFEDDFFTYFGLTARATNVFTSKVIDESRILRYGEMLEDAASVHIDSAYRARLNMLTHPLFGTTEFLLDSSPQFPLDQGRMAEFYFIRHMLCVYEAEADPPWLTKLIYVSELTPDPARFRSLLRNLDVEVVTPSRQELCDIHARLDAEEVFTRATQLLAFHLRHEPSVFNRYRTISYWFFRESLLFGSTSHWSCCFDRVAIGRLIETCLFMLAFAEPDSDSALEFRSLLELIEEILSVHAAFLTPRASAIYNIDEEEMQSYKEGIRAFLTHPLLNNERLASHLVARRGIEQRREKW